jgi:hypothetical protein
MGTTSNQEIGDISDFENSLAPPKGESSIRKFPYPCGGLSLEEGAASSPPPVLHLMSCICNAVATMKTHMIKSTTFT